LGSCVVVIDVCECMHLRDARSFTPNPNITTSGKSPKSVDCRATGGARRLRGTEGYGGAMSEGLMEGHNLRKIRAR